MTLKGQALLAVAVLALGSALPASAADPWDAFNLSPASRTLLPQAVHRTFGSVENASGLVSGGVARLTGDGTSVTLDYGREVGGVLSMTFSGASASGRHVLLAFSESSLYVGSLSDASNGGLGPDGALDVEVPESGTWTVPCERQRGGFRYVTLTLVTPGWVELSGVSVEFTAAPGMAVPRAYANHFWSSDELLNRIWYAGAYTVQLGTIAPGEGRIWPPPASGWSNGAVVGVGDSVLVDGAKRDRTIWPSDLGIAVPTAFVSTGDVVSTRNALTTLYQKQLDATGELPFAGPVVNRYGSDTYHLWTLVATHSYVLYSGDLAWLDSVWPRYVHAIAYALGKLGPSGLLDVTGTDDWARFGQGGENVAANALLCRVLITGAELAQLRGEAGSAADYSGRASALRSSINALLWDEPAGAYRDNPASALHPQDGNALAAWFSIPDTAERARRISDHLRRRWNRIGGRTPEWGDDIATFPGSLEVQAHFTASEAVRALDLIRRLWGYMLESPFGTRSTFWEGFRADGSFAYGGSYMSLAHGWATGPTSALTFFVLGLRPGLGARYGVAPQPADLVHAEGRLTMASGGVVDVSWDRGACGGFTLTVDSAGYPGSTGVLAVPRFGENRAITLNGTLAWDGSTFLGAPGVASADQDAAYVYFRDVAPGSRTLSSAAGACRPALAVADSSAAESRDLHGAFTVSLSSPAAEEIVVGYATLDGSARAGQDYEASTGSLTFAPGVTTQLIKVPLIDDAVDEPEETFFVRLTPVAGSVQVERLEATAFLASDEAPAVGSTLSIDDRDVAEGVDSNAAFRVVLQPPSAEAVTLTWTSVDGSAVSGADYVAASGSLTFTPGRTTHAIAVPVLSDALAEGQEEFFVDLKQAFGATIADGRGVGRVQDRPAADDVPMYRAYNPNAFYHFFTTSLAEFDNAVAAGYRDESNPPCCTIPFKVPNLQGTGRSAIFRMYNPNNGRHYYTSNSGERDILMGIGWVYEKDEGFVYTAEQLGIAEVFKLYNNVSGVHLYTVRPDEKDAILAQFPGIWFQHTSLGFAVP